MRAFSIVLTFFLSVATTTSLLIDEEDKVQKFHENAETHNWPFMSVLTFGRFIFCTGILIRPYWILSAGSCFKKNETGTLRETFGQMYARVGPKEVFYMDWNMIAIKNISTTSYAPTVTFEDLILIDKYFLHPRFRAHYTSANLNDIGICKLLRPGGPNLPQLTIKPTSESMVCITATYKSFVRNEQETRIPGLLQEFYGNPYTDSSCEEKIKKLGNTTHPVFTETLEDKFCLSLGNVSTIKELNQFSLNGAPILCNNELHGVSCVLTVEGKQGNGKIYHEYIEVYTDFQQHANWIEKMLIENGDEGISKNRTARNKPPEQMNTGNNLHPSFYLILCSLLYIINRYV